MKALLKKELCLTRKLLLIWMGIVLLLCAFAYFEYLSLQENLEELAGLIHAFPEILTIMAGATEEMTSPMGWYGCIYYWVAILVYSYAVYLGISCMVKEKTQGTAEYIFTKPVNRGQIVMAKIFASVCNLLVLTVFSGLCNYFASVRPLGGLENRGAAITTTMGMFLTTIVLFALAFLVSSLSKTYKRTALFGTGLLLGCYGIYIVAELLEFRLLYYFTPLKYFDVYTVAREGISLIFLLLAAVITTLSVAIAKKMWIDREIGI